jgi:phage tail-like protein
MTQIATDTLWVQMTAMSPPETVDATAIALLGQTTAQIPANALGLYPGEPSEIKIRVENFSDRHRRWRLHQVWDFPASWCEGEPTNEREVLPQEIDEVILTFTAPSDFFESPTNCEQLPLKLNYQCEIEVYELNQNGERTISYRVFDLYVRPRVTYLDFLPTLFRETDFFSRFLAIFEETFDPYVQTIDTLWAYLDPLTAPQTLLPFLAHWVAWDIEPEWDIERQRHLIRNALELYRWHGTRKGLQRYLSLYTDLPCDDAHIAITEVFAGGFTFGSCELGSNAMMGGGRPYHFAVCLRPEQPEPAIDEALVRKVIERQKPPFCTYDLSIEPGD